MTSFRKTLNLLIAGSATFAAMGSNAQTFADVTTAAGISGGGGSWSAAWGDYDHDGDLDLATVCHLQLVTGGKNVLWRNKGDGTFEDITAEANMLSDKIDTHGSGWADFDRDGDLDLVMINESITNKSYLFNELWRNNNDGTFSEIGDAAGIIALDHITRNVATADYDRDGLLDFFVAVQDLAKNPGDPQAYSPNNLLWHNDGNLSFTDVAITAGVAMPMSGRKRTGTFSDYDNDGWPDLLVMPNCTLFKNNKDGTFTDVTATAGILQSSQCQGAGWGDYDRDGNIDVLISHGFDSVEPSHLYHNNGDGTFTDATASSGIAINALSRSVNWGDYDNDGDLDVYIVSLNNATEPNHLYRNNNNGTFTDVTAATNTGAQVVGSGAHGAFVDYDGDGDLDLFVSNGEGTAKGPYVLLKNSGNNNRWLKVKLIGIASNIDAIGSKLKMETASFTSYAANSATAWMSQSQMPVHFGMAAETSARRITIDWPNGARQKIENIGANQTITLEEGVGIQVGAATMIADGIYISTEGSRWKLSWRGVSSSSRFSGRITTTGTFSNVATANFESNDTITTTANSISFSGTDNGGSPDTIEFDASTTAVTFNVKQDGIAQPAKVYLGKYSVKPSSVPLRITR